MKIFKWHIITDAEYKLKAYWNEKYIAAERERREWQEKYEKLTDRDEKGRFKK